MARSPQFFPRKVRDLLGPQRSERPTNRIRSRLRELKVKTEPRLEHFSIRQVKQEKIVGKSKTKFSSKASKKKSLDALKPINLNAAGIEIGADSHWVSVPTDRDEQHVREFRCYTPDLYALADWLKQCKVEPGVDVYEQQYQQRVLKNLQRKTDQLGFELVPLSNES